jgi:serine phosphatase RsbU (regulator of sigma subunit)
MTKKDIARSGIICLISTVIVAGALTFTNPSYWIIYIRDSFVFSFCIGISISILIYFFSNRLKVLSLVPKSGALFVFFLTGGFIGTEIGTILLKMDLDVQGHFRLLLFNLLLATIFGGVALLYYSLQERMQRMVEKLIEQQRIKEELDLARKIQQGLFPKASPEVAGLDISGMSIPALSVGGDYYDFVQLDSQKILAVVADVSGKGMSAALYMSKIQGMIQLAAHMYRTPKEMLININRRIFEGIDRKSFITMILALFDMKKKEVRICRAGHNKALLSVDGKIRFLEGGGMGLGLERGPLFENAIEEVRIPIKPESLFLFYTDGITEAMNEKQQQLGEDAIVHMLNANRLLSANKIQQAILTAVEKFRGTAEQHDDVTMVVVKSVSTRKVKDRR